MNGFIDRTIVEKGKGRVEYRLYHLVSIEAIGFVGWLVWWYPALLTSCTPLLLFNRADCLTSTESWDIK